MKKLMLGNEAIARGLYEADCKVVSSYPGTPSTEITEFASEYDDIYTEWAPNEKVAVEVSLGASIGGVRSFSAMKHVGLNVAADPVFTSAYTGINGGFVIAVADDPGMHSSQNEQDSRHYAIASKIPMLEPSDSSECLSYVKMAFEISELFDTPVFIRLTTRVSHSQSITEISDKEDHPIIPYVKNAAKYVMVPQNARARHVVVEERIKKIKEWTETCSVNKIEINNSEIGVITSGISYLYTKEALGDKVSYLKLGIVNPLPDKLIMDFCSKFKKIYVIEELDPIIEQYCAVLGIKVYGKELFSNIGELSSEIIKSKILNEDSEFSIFPDAVPGRPPVLCPGCPHRGIFYVLKKLKLMVNGDIGCYTLGSAAPLESIDTTICMGFSVSGLHGFNKAISLSKDNTKAVAILGDSTFIHSGITGLINIAYNNSNSTVIILDNSITGMTGHQQNPTTGYNIKGDPAVAVDLEALCHAVGIKRVTVVDPHDIDETEKVIKTELQTDGPSVIIARRPCILLKTAKIKEPLKVDKDKCKSCKQCMKIGCPSISFNDNKSFINPSLCVGCDLCKKLCKFDAIN